ncbi:hypothetical protein R1sor_027342 [Riccia sorocarpa]|uniref:Reverse transcriptase domain-containing protein n=1 Tax=Riccia sorocarpa TaxID=122646 RepID=A0ABD3GI60_9MARC
MPRGSSLGANVAGKGSIDITGLDEAETQILLSQLHANNSLIEQLLTKPLQSSSPRGSEAATATTAATANGSPGLAQTQVPSLRVGSTSYSTRATLSQGQTNENANAGDSTRGTATHEAPSASPTARSTRSSQQQSYAKMTSGQTDTSTQPSSAPAGTQSSHEGLNVETLVPAALNSMPQPEVRTEPTKVLLTTLEDEDALIIGKRLHELQEMALILFTGGMNPKRGAVVKWVKENMVTKLGITVLQLRVLDRSNYMVVTSSKEDQAKVLSGCPFYMNGRFFRIYPWTPDYDTFTSRGKRRPVWVNIHGMNAALGHLGVRTLKKLGTLLHLAVTEEELDLAKQQAEVARAQREAEENQPPSAQTPSGAHTPAAAGNPAGRGGQPQKTGGKKPNTGRENPAKTTAGAGTGNPFAALASLDEEEEETPRSPTAGAKVSNLDLNIATMEEQVANEVAKTPEGSERSSPNPNGGTPRNTQESTPGPSNSDAIMSEGSEQEELDVEATVSLLSPTENPPLAGTQNRRSFVGVHSAYTHPGAHVIIDYTTTDRGGAALIIDASMNILESGVRGNGSIAWAKTSSAAGTIGFVSAYGPHPPSEKLEFLNWIQDHQEDRRWVFMGDWNFVIEPEDTAGPTALARGQIKTEWNRTDERHNLCDVYHRAAKKVGPRFTRQVIRNNRVDQARLDRVYLNQDGEWVGAVKCIHHDGQSSVSDHIPVKVDLKLDLADEARPRKSQYIKMDVESISDPGRNERIKEAWIAGWELSPNPIVAWELAWGRVRQLYKSFRKEDQRTRAHLQKDKRKLEEMRILLSENSGSINLEEFRTLEEKVKKAELLEVSILRRRSRQTWVKSGEACTKFFFEALKSKQAKEKMSCIITDVGEEIVQEDQILKTVHSYYSEIYQQPNINMEDRQEQSRIMGLVTNKVSGEENRKIALQPTMTELLHIVEGMAREKAPGEDGLTMELLLATWEWTGEACLKLLNEFWETQNLGWKNLSAVVRLLPKNGEKNYLRNWRPISLLALTYKIVARILASRIKTIVPRLVDEEQAGFVDGRTITDNILCLKLSQELAEERQRPTIFCKLDFSKAFDRVQHVFLWETMRQMNFCPEYIQLVQGLVSRGSAKIHINGSATESFPLQQGVRQGCPISPLLFAISTQPLMLLLREEERNGNLVGLHIPQGRPLLHKLFADDSGVCLNANEQNFTNLRSVIVRFERASGALLNVTKSVILPMAMTRHSQWLQDTGCKIMVGRDEDTYLGVKFGRQVNESVYARDLSERLKKRLTHWTHRFLNWPSRVILLRHVLRSIPTYQFLGVGLMKEGYDQLETLCRIFMWGVNTEGKAKTPLIAWSGITKPYNEGGLQYKPFSVTADSLKMRYMARLMEGEHSEWAQMLRYFIRTGMRSLTSNRERREWSVEEGLLLLPTIPTPKSSTTRHFVRSWLKIRAHLEIDGKDLSLPGSLSLNQLSALQTRYASDTWFNARTVLPILKKLGISHLIHLRTGFGEWRDLTTDVTRANLELNPENRLDLINFQCWLTKISLGNHTLQGCTNWRWKGSETKWTGWIQPSRFWGMLLSKHGRIDDLSHRWPGDEGSLDWASRWKLLWQKGDSPRSRLWVWRTLKKGFFTWSRASKMRVTQLPCPRCNRAEETVPHLLWECSEVRGSWAALRIRTPDANVKFKIRQSLLSTIDEALVTKKQSGALLSIIATQVQLAWKDRNAFVFQNKRRRTPIIVALIQAREDIEGSFSRTSSESKWQRGLTGLKELNEIIQLITREFSEARERDEQSFKDGLNRVEKEIEELRHFYLARKGFSDSPIHSPREDQKNENKSEQSPPFQFADVAHWIPRENVDELLQAGYCVAKQPPPQPTAPKDSPLPEYIDFFSMQKPRDD